MPCALYGGQECPQQGNPDVEHQLRATQGWGQGQRGQLKGTSLIRFYFVWFGVLGFFYMIKMCVCDYTKSH